MTKSRRMRWLGHTTLTDSRNAYIVFIGNVEGMTLLGRLRLRGAENIKTDFKGIGWKSMS
jgi:hypothetical protein